MTDDLTWLRGKHQFQFGGEYELDTINLLYINRPNGNFTYDPFWTKMFLEIFCWACHTSSSKAQAIRL